MYRLYYRETCEYFNRLQDMMELALTLPANSFEAQERNEDIWIDCTQNVEWAVAFVTEVLDEMIAGELRDMEAWNCTVFT